MFYYKDFQTKGARSTCNCQNIEIYCEEQESSHHEFFIMTVYKKERPDIFETDEDDLDKRYPFC